MNRIIDEAKLLYVSVDKDGITPVFEVTRSHPEHISPICRCECNHVLFAHVEDTTADEKREMDLPEHGCGMTGCECEEFRCTRKDHERLNLP